MTIRSVLAASGAAAAVLLGVVACGGGEAGSSATETSATSPDTATDAGATGTTETVPTTNAATTDESATNQSTTDESTDARLPDGWTTCSNEQHGYSIGYPEEWSTAALRAEDRCRWFDREPFELEEATEAPLTDVSVSPTIGTFQQAARQLKDPFGERVIEREGVEIGGTQAIRFEKELTESLLYTVGTRTYGYVVNDRGTALWIETRNPPNVDVPYVENREIVDQAVETLVLADES